MIFLSIFRLIMIFPFMVYFILVLNTKSTKQAKIMIAPLYFLSTGFIVKYLFETPQVILILSLIVIMTVILSLRILRSKYKLFSFSKLIRQTLRTFSTIYPMIYVILFIYGVGTIFITMR